MVCAAENRRVCTRSGAEHKIVAIQGKRNLYIQHEKMFPGTEKRGFLRCKKEKRIAEVIRSRYGTLRHYTS
jgi:hypothetical protein